MGLELSDDDILYEGRAVGRLEYDSQHSRGRITLDVEFDCEPGAQVLPLVAFSRALTTLEQPPPDALLSVTTEPDEITYIDGPRLLIEEIIKVRPNVWQFHKTDRTSAVAATWPGLFLKKI